WPIAGAGARAWMRRAAIHGVGIRLATPCLPVAGGAHHPEQTRERAMKTSIQVVFYSMYGHVHTMAEAVAEGAREYPDTEVTLLQVPELVPEGVLEKSGAAKARAAFAHVPVARPEQLVEPDAIIFGTPTRFGNMCGQMRNFVDQLGPHWAKAAFEGKVGSVFTSSNTQHGGQE